MFNKKAQAQVITTVLIILLVLAGVVILWRVVSGTIHEGGEQIDTQSGCIGVSMEITSADTSTNEATIRRMQGSADTKVTGYKLFVGGVKKNEVTKDLGPLDTDTITVTDGLVSGNMISVAAIVGTTVCAASSEFEVA